MKVVSCCLVLLVLVALSAQAEQRSAALFDRRCRACHTFGHGDLVGPDLKGVTDRRSRKWLMAWITSSQRLVQAGDPQATALFEKYRRIPMPDQSFAPGELEALLDFFADGGPDAEARRNRRAEMATPADIEMGRALFTGGRALASGGAPCLACHRVAESALGGTLGPDLTDAYSKFQDRRLASLIARGCFPRAPEIARRKALTDDETFALKAFLRQVDTRLRAIDSIRGYPRH